MPSSSLPLSRGQGVFLVPRQVCEAGCFSSLLAGEEAGAQEAPLEGPEKSPGHQPSERSPQTQGVQKVWNCVLGPGHSGCGSQRRGPGCDLM